MVSEVQAQKPRKLLILPKDTSSDARICTLAHPRTSRPSRYYICPEKGVFEFTRIAAPKSACQSWLLGPHASLDSRVPNQVDGEDLSPLSVSEGVKKQCSATKVETDSGPFTSKSTSEDYIIKTAEVFVATPIDPLFLLLPSLQSSSTKSTSSKQLFLSIDDLMDSLGDESRHFDQLQANEYTRLSMEARLKSVCDMVQAGDEKMYRLNSNKLLSELLVKARRTVALGLPVSMEDRFIRKALETPVMGLKREQSSTSETADISQLETGLPTPEPSEGTESQSSIVTSAVVAAEDSAPKFMTMPQPDLLGADADEIRHLLRLRTALSYMISAYIAPPLAATLNTLLASPESPVEFKRLDEYLARIASMRAEALASRSLSDFSRKRGMNEDNEAVEIRTEKKRRKDEEEKRKKAGESRGIKNLKKADTSGMKKMSDFFGKGLAAEKKK